ncbi:hypothetical protein GCM10027160_23970 [Streptomyces calidiresistens]
MPTTITAITTWNTHHPIGTPVTAQPLIPTHPRHRQGVPTHTRSLAFHSPHLNAPAVRVLHLHGPIPLTHITPHPQPPTPPITTGPLTGRIPFARYDPLTRRIIRTLALPAGHGLFTHWADPHTRYAITNTAGTRLAHGWHTIHHAHTAAHHLLTTTPHTPWATITDLDELTLPAVRALARITPTRATWATPCPLDPAILHPRTTP